jgi:hypothetical protein
MLFAINLPSVAAQDSLCFPFTTYILSASFIFGPVLAALGENQVVSISSPSNPNKLVYVHRHDINTGDVSENTLIAEGTNPFNGQPIRLYKLAGGGYQINSTQPNGEPYTFAWS